jgi:hypothetical protein
MEKIFWKNTIFKIKDENGNSIDEKSSVNFLAKKRKTFHLHHLLVKIKKKDISGPKTTYIKISLSRPF